MKGTRIAAEASELPSARERGEYFVKKALSGAAYDVQLAPVVTTAGSDHLTMYVMNTALRLGEAGDNFQPGVTAEQAQRLADTWQMVLPTALMADAVWRQGAKVSPTLRKSGPAMASPQYMLSASAERAQKAPAAGLVGQAGKWWVNSPRLWAVDKNGALVNATKGANYGLYFWPAAKPVKPPTPGPRPAATGTKTGTLYQTVGLAHSYANFTDYSQTMRAFSRWGLLKRGDAFPEMVDLADLAVDPELFPLVALAPTRLHHPAGGGAQCDPLVPGDCPELPKKKPIVPTVERGNYAAALPFVFGLAVAALYRRSEK